LWEYLGFFIGHVVAEILKERMHASSPPQRALRWHFWCSTDLCRSFGQDLNGAETRLQPRASGLVSA
jgi:hypothetical protein